MTDSGGSAGSADASTSSVLHLLDASASASLPPPASPPTPQRTTAMASRQSSLSRQNAEEVLRLLMTDDIGLLSDTVQTPPLRHHSPVELTPQPISPPAATAPSAAPSAATATAPSVTASAPLASTSGGSGSSSSLSLSSSASAVLAPRAAAPGSGRLHVYYGERQQSLSVCGAEGGAAAARETQHKLTIVQNKREKKNGRFCCFGQPLCSVLYLYPLPLIAALELHLDWRLRLGVRQKEM